MANKKILLIIFIILITGCTVGPDNSQKENNKAENIIEEEKGEREESIDPIKLQVANMTLEEKIGQLVLVGMEGYEVNENISNLIKSYKVGGVILYGKNVRDSSQLTSLISSLKSANSSNKPPLFISVDEEGGPVSRNPKEVKKIPSARSIGIKGDGELAFQLGRQLATTLKTFGYNMNFAPVLDIDSNPKNPVIGDRSYGNTAETVSAMGIKVMKGIESEGIIPVIKHFPGHGDTAVDSHIGLPIINHSLERLNNFEIVPFKHAIDEEADVVMVAHILLSKLDSGYPASMSREVIENMLRDQLGFEGVIITDDMTMGAIVKNYSIENAAIQSIKAGVDILLVGHGYENALATLNIIKSEVDKGNITVERIDESVYRILRLKDKYGLSNTVKG